MLELVSSEFACHLLNIFNGMWNLKNSVSLILNVFLMVSLFFLEEFELQCILHLYSVKKRVGKGEQ